MHAEVGDLLAVRGHKEGSPDRHAEIWRQVKPVIRLTPSGGSTRTGRESCSPVRTHRSCQLPSSRTVRKRKSA
jgi:hypothetical protein